MKTIYLGVGGMTLDHLIAIARLGNQAIAHLEVIPQAGQNVAQQSLVLRLRADTRCGGIPRQQ